MSGEGKVNSRAPKAYDARVPNIQDYRKTGSEEELVQRVSTYGVSQPNAGDVYQQKIQSGQVQSNQKPNPDRVFLEAANGIGEAALDLDIDLDGLEHLQNLADNGELPDGF